MLRREPAVLQLITSVIVEIVPKIVKLRKKNPTGLEDVLLRHVRACASVHVCAAAVGVTRLGPDASDIAGC